MRKPFSWVLVALLVAVLAGQATSAYTMPCRGTATCCCSVPMAMDMASAGMAEGAGAACCDTSPAMPCDIERDPHPAAMTFVPAPAAEGGHAGPPAEAWAGTAVPTAPLCPLVWDSTGRSDRGRPPIYLAILTLLC